MRTRKTISALIFSSAFVASNLSAAIAAPACLHAGDASAFNLIGLKSTLMVEALSCGMDKNYDRFMVKFQPQVLQAQRQMDSYFARQGGGFGGQGLEDEFTTQLANSESDAAAAQGPGFCAGAAKQFAAVDGLTDTTSLAGYAIEEKIAAPPQDAALCPAEPAAPRVVIASATPAKPRATRKKPTQAPELAADKPATPPAPPAQPGMSTQMI